MKLVSSLPQLSIFFSCQVAAIRLPNPLQHGRLLLARAAAQAAGNDAAAGACPWAEVAVASAAAGAAAVGASAGRICLDLLLQKVDPAVGQRLFRTADAAGAALQGDIRGEGDVAPALALPAGNDLGAILLCEPQHAAHQVQHLNCAGGQGQEGQGQRQQQSEQAGAKGHMT